MEKGILDRLKVREQFGSIALGCSIALHHDRLDGNNPPLVLLARLRYLIDLAAKDDQPADLVFLVLWLKKASKGLLPVLAEICQMLGKPAVLRQLRAASSPDEVVALVRQASSAAPAAGAAPAKE